MKRGLLFFIVIVSLGVGAFVTLPQAEAAGYCPFVYRVQPGDTLSMIAFRARTNVRALARFNRIWNVHHIYAGQILCLPRPIAGPKPDKPVQPPPPAAHSSFDLVVQYTFEVTADNEASKWTVGRDRQAGLRLSYKIASGDSIDSRAEPSEVKDTSVVTGSPILWLARNSNSTAYTLVVIGQIQPLLDLQLGFTRTITELLPNLPTEEEIEQALKGGFVDLLPETRMPVAALIDPEIGAVSSLRAELAGVDGTFVPLTIDQFDYQSNLKVAELRYPEPGFALHATADPERDGYILIMVLNDDGTLGPPGPRWRPRCSRWQSRRWWSRVRWFWYGC